MANFVKNIVDFYGSKDELEKLISFFKQGNRKELDFNLVVPEPKDLVGATAPYDSKGLLVGEYLVTGKLGENLGHNQEWLNRVKNQMREILGRHFASDKELVEAYIASLVQEGKPELGKKYLAMYKTWYNNWKTYGYPDWYEWRMKNWGTKWNACNGDSLDTISLKKGYKDSYSMQYTFETPGCMPEMFFLALAKMFPKISIEVQYANEDIGADVGIMSFEDGEETCDERYDLYTRDAVEQAMIVWGDDDQIPYLVEDEEGNWSVDWDAYEKDAG